MDVMLAEIQGQASEENFRVTQHAQVEMDAEEITLMAVPIGSVISILFVRQRNRGWLQLQYMSHCHPGG